MPKPEKLESVAAITKLFKDSTSCFVTDYQGLNVEDITELRKNLRENNIRYLIAKNTLIKIGAKEAGTEGLDEHLNGPTAIAFTADDPAVAAKILNDCFKKNELPRMKVFIVDEQVYDGADIKRLADLPPRDIILSMVVAAVEAPFSELIGSLDGFFRDLVGSIDALEEKVRSES